MTPPAPPTVTTRTTFETLIESRLREAKLLLNGGEWDGAYYLTGYAVEFAFKVRIIADLMKSNGYPDRKQVDNFYKHDLLALVQAAGLKQELENDPAVKQAWSAVKDWSEQARYQHGRSEADARALYDAVVNEVLPWIRSRW